MSTMPQTVHQVLRAIFRNHNPCSQCEQDFCNANNLCSQCEQGYTGSHVTLRMLDVDCVQCFYGI